MIIFAGELAAGVVMIIYRVQVSQINYASQIKVKSLRNVGSLQVCFMNYPSNKLLKVICQLFQKLSLLPWQLVC